MNEKTKRLVSLMVGRPVESVRELTQIEIEVCLNSWASRWDEPDPLAQAFGRAADAAIGLVRTDEERRRDEAAFTYDGPSENEMRHGA